MVLATGSRTMFIMLTDLSPRLTQSGWKKCLSNTRGPFFLASRKNNSLSS